MNRPLLLLALASLAPASLAQTQVSGTVSGTWDLAGSPYLLTDNTYVVDTLDIEPGVRVVGTPDHRLEAFTGARLRAVGTADDPIVFTAQDPNLGWRGVRLNGAADDSLLRHCVIEYAKATGDVRGGALGVFSCAATVEDCELRWSSTNNELLGGQGGGALLEFFDGVFRRNHVHGNSADSGGGIAVTGSGSPEVSANLVTDNSASSAGGGVYLGSLSSPLVARNRISRNHADGLGGGGVSSWAGNPSFGIHPTLRSNAITHNSSSSDGGGLYCRYDGMDSQGDLVAFNSAPQGSALYYVDQGSSPPRLRNAIVWGNQGPTLVANALPPGNVEIEFSLVQGGWPGQGNLSADPLFLEPLGGDGLAGTDDDDYRLGPNSPCIDAGDGSGLDLGSLDADGQPRFVDDACVPNTGLGSPPIDVGPYERQHSSCWPDPVRFCTATPNSTGQGATLQWLGNLSWSTNDLRLQARRCPPSKPALLFYGLGQAAAPSPLGNGVLCAASPVYRVTPATTTDSNGAREIALDLTTPPLGGGPGTVVPGMTAWFQLWYRDPAAGGAASNTSDGVAVPFAP